MELESVLEIELKDDDEISLLEVELLHEVINKVATKSDKNLILVNVNTL